MSNLYYTATVILAIVIHLIINHTYYIRKDGRREVRYYRNCLSMILIYYVTDVAYSRCWQTI